MNYGPAIQAQAGEQLHDFPKPSSLNKTIQQVVEGQYTSCQKEDSYEPFIIKNMILEVFLLIACYSIPKSSSSS